MGGGTSLEVLSRIAVLEKEISDLKQTIATPDTYGLSKITDATDVTENNGLVLGAVQNNASVPGTLANKIQSISESRKFVLLPLEVVDESLWQIGATACFANFERKEIVLNMDLYFSESIQRDKWVPVLNVGLVNFTTFNVFGPRMVDPYYCDSYYNGVEKKVYAHVPSGPESSLVKSNAYRFSAVTCAI